MGPVWRGLFVADRAMGTHFGDADPVLSHFQACRMAARAVCLVGAFCGIFESVHLFAQLKSRETGARTRTCPFVREKVLQKNAKKC